MKIMKLMAYHLPSDRVWEKKLCGDFQWEYAEYVGNILNYGEQFQQLTK